MPSRRAAIDRSAELGAQPTLEQLSDFLVEFPKGAHARAASDRRLAVERERAEAEASRERAEFARLRKLASEIGQ